MKLENATMSPPHIVQSATVSKMAANACQRMTEGERRLIDRLFRAASRPSAPAPRAEPPTSLLEGLDAPGAKRVAQLFGGSRGFHHAAAALQQVAKRVVR